MNASKDNPLLEIAKRLRLRIQMNENTVDMLDDFSGSIRTHVDWFDKPDEIQDFVHKFREYMQSYSSILQKILKQIEDEITEEHIHSLRNISNRNDVELQRCFQFQRYAIARGANDAKAGPLLQEIYTTIRDRIESDKELGALIADMLRYTQTGNEQHQHPHDQFKPDSRDHHVKHGLRTRSAKEESTGEQVYKLVLSFFLRTNIGRLIALIAFICIGISFAMNYTPKGPGMVDAITNSDFEKDGATLNQDKPNNHSENRALEPVPSDEIINAPTDENVVPNQPE